MIFGGEISTKKSDPPSSLDLSLWREGAKIPAIRWITSAAHESAHKQRCSNVSACVTHQESKEIYTRFARKLKSAPIQSVLRQTSENVDEESSEKFLNLTGNRHPDYHFLQPYDRSWMNNTNCEWLTFHMFHRQDPTRFVSGINAPALLLQQGFLPVDTPGDMDVVAYVDLNREKPYIGHFGVMHQGRVISKNWHGNVANHTVDAFGMPFSHVIFFRRQIDLTAPMWVNSNAHDWIVQHQVPFRMPISRGRLLWRFISGLTQGRRKS